MIFDKRKTLRDFQGELLQNLYQEFPDLVLRLRDLRPLVQETIIYPFLDEGRRLGYIPERASNEAVAIFLQVVGRGFDESPHILRQFASEPELFDQVHNLIIHGLVSDRP